MRLTRELSPRLRVSSSTNDAMTPGDTCKICDPIVYFAYVDRTRCRVPPGTFRKDAASHRADGRETDRQDLDDILRYSRSSKETGIKKGEYARVVTVSAQANTLTVVRGNGEQTHL